MIWFALFVLLLWVPIVYLIFESMPSDRATVFSFVFAWLFLPGIVIPLPGLPDWSKMTATTFGVFLIGWMKNSSKFTRLRWSRYDVPIFVFCITPLFSSISNQQGAYDGVSAVLEECFRWGLPYLIGRVFLGEARGIRLLCVGLAVGGMIYVPLCLFEIRMSPILKLLVYGYSAGGMGDFGLRYGGYRPAVFLHSGLELGWWMCCSSLAALLLWRGGVIQQIRGYPMAVLTVGLMLVTVACKSTGAMVQIIVGLIVFSIARRTKSVLPVWALMAIPVLYCICRPMGWWDGSTLLNLSSSLFGQDRTQSLGYRFEQEEYMMQAAMQRPFFGWSRSVGFNVGPDGRIIIMDGLWIIVFGRMGVFALAALNAMHLLPTLLFIRRYRPIEWMRPAVVPALTFAIILPLYMIDNLSNAMVNPVFALCMGAMTEFLTRSRNPGIEQSGGLTRHKTTQDREYPRRPRFVTDCRWHDQMADALEADATAAATDGSDAEAWEHFTQAIAHRQAAVDHAGNFTRIHALARSHVRFARFLTPLNYPQFAIDERTGAIQVWRSLDQADAKTKTVLQEYAANVNDLAWLLIFSPEADSNRFEQAVELAEEAVRLGPDHASFWNTLGIGYYQRQDYYKAIHALSRSVSLADEGGNAFDFYFLALANHALGYRAPAQDWLSRADHWAASRPDWSETLVAVRAEVARTFGQSKQRSSV